MAAIGPDSNFFAFLEKLTGTLIRLVEEFVESADWTCKQESEQRATENTGISPVTEQPNNQENESNHVQPVVCDTEDSEQVQTENTGVSPITEKQRKVAPRRRKDAGTLHAPRHAILSRPLLEALARRGENIRELRRIESALREELQPRGVIGALLMDRVWSSYLRCVLVSRTESFLLTSDGPPTDFSSLIPNLPKPVKTDFSYDVSLLRLQRLAVTERYDSRFAKEFFRGVGFLLSMRDGGGSGLARQIERTTGKDKDLVVE